MTTAVNINSDILQLQQLELQYKTLLNEYKTAHASYVTTIQSQSKDSNSYVVLPGKTYMGSGSISDNRNSSISECEALCSANKSCTGATFNSISNVCKLRKGRGLISDGASSDNAIITKITQQLVNLETINSRLILINNQMIVISNRIQPNVNENVTTLATNNGELMKNNDSLKAEQNKIKKMLDEYRDVNQSYINQSLNVEQKSASYYMWLIIMIVSVSLVFKFVFFPDSRGNSVSVILWSIIIICLVLATMHLNNPSAYAIWISIIAVILMMKAQLIPSI